MHYHLIGIAGTAMASLAGLLREKGHRVTGSDQGVYPPMSVMLDDLGIAYADRYDPGNLASQPDMVVVGNAISRGNPELEAVLDRRLRYTSAAAVIKDEFLAGRHVVAVAGTHGKTTTASLIAWLLEVAGLDPSFLIGGIPGNFGISFRLTGSEFFVIEADEYDTAYFDKGPKMWHYLPWTAGGEQRRVRSRGHLPGRCRLPLRLRTLHQPGAAGGHAGGGLGLPRAARDVRDFARACSVLRDRW